MSGKKSLQAKIVKHAHRRRFQDYVRTKGRDKSTLAYVYWSMYLRSGKGNVFILDEDLFLGDLGLTHPTLSGARNVLIKDGWLSKGKQTFDPQTGRWSTVRWTVNEEPVVKSVHNGTDVKLSDNGSTDSGSTDSGSFDNTVVVHSLDADAYTSSSTPEGVTPTDELSESVSESSAAAAASLTPQALELAKLLYRNRIPEDISSFAADLNRIAAANPEVNWQQLFAWNRTHKPARLVYRDAKRFIRGVEYSLGNYAEHDPNDCVICRKAKTNGAKPGTHAERNPELHTGKRADGTSWTEGAIKI